MTYSSFAGPKLLVTGSLEEMLRRTKAYLDAGGTEQLLIFNNKTGEQVDFNFNGTLVQVLDRAFRPPQKKGPGRPRLGVTSREVSLLPRHWEWLDAQPQSASATIRRLVEAARRNSPDGGTARQQLEAAGRFMWAIAGDFENFEEASRSLYARNWHRLRTLTSAWPADIREHLLWAVRNVETAQTV